MRVMMLLLALMLSPAIVRAQTSSTVVVTLDTPPEDWPEYLCVVARDPWSNGADTLTFSQQHAGNLAGLPDGLAGDLGGAIQRLKASSQGNSCGLANSSCRASVTLPGDLSASAFMSCARNTTRVLTEGRVLVAAVTFQNGTPLAVRTNSLRGNVVEIEARVTTRPNVDLYFELAGGHYAADGIARIWERRAVIGLRPICSMRDVVLPSVSGRVEETHDLSIITAGTPPQADAPPRGDPHLSCSTRWSPVLRLAIPEAARSLTLVLTRPGMNVPEREPDAEWRAVWASPVVPQSFAWRVRRANFAWRVRPEAPFAFTGCPRADLPDVVRCVGTYARQPSLDDERSVRSSGVPGDGVSRSIQDFELLRRLGHDGEAFCFYRCDDAENENRGDGAFDLPAETAWSVRVEGTDQTVASWREPLLRPLQVFDGYAPPAERRLVVGLDAWPAEDFPAYSTAEINLADAGGLTYHLRPYDWSHIGQPIARRFFVTFPSAQEGSPVTYRVLGYDHHALGHAQVSHGVIQIPAPSETIDREQGGTRLSLDAVVLGDVDQLGASVGLARRTWSDWRRCWWHLPEAEVAYRAATRALVGETEHRVGLALGTAVGLVLNRHFHLGLGARLGVTADVWTANVPADARFGFDARAFALVRYQLSSLVAVEVEASPLGVSYYRGDWYWSGLELRIGPRVWAW